MKKCSLLTVQKPWGFHQRSINSHEPASRARGSSRSDLDRAPALSRCVFTGILTSPFDACTCRVLGGLAVGERVVVGEPVAADAAVPQGPALR